MEKEIEIWKSVVGYEGYYEISNLGNVLSLERVIEYEYKTKSGIIIKRSIKKSKKLKTRIGDVGYYTTDFQVNNIKQTFAVRLQSHPELAPSPFGRHGGHAALQTGPHATLLAMGWPGIGDGNGRL